MAIMFRNSRVAFAQQVPVEVFFQGELVGKYVADMIVDGQVVLEFKAVRKLLPTHESQVLNLLRATNLEVGLLMNFGLDPEFKRFISTNRIVGALARAGADPRSSA